MSKFIIRSIKKLPETLILGAVISLTCLLTANVVRSQQEAHQEAEFRPALLSLSPEKAIGGTNDFFGSPSAPYTVVFFGDYQCPPCRRQSAAIADLVNSDNRVKVAFRNRPLDKIHPFARAAAECAEAARYQGRFWQFHDALYANQASLSATTGQSIAKDMRLDSHRFAANIARARDTIRQDEAIADAQHLDAVPSLLLCTPEGKVYKVSSAKQIEDFLP